MTISACTSSKDGKSIYAASESTILAVIGDEHTPRIRVFAQETIKTDPRRPPDGTIRCLTLLPDEKELAVVTDDKTLWILKVDTLETKSTRTLPRRACAITCADAERLLIADKFGDVYSYPMCTQNSEEEVDSIRSTSDGGRLELGHVSMVLDMAMTKVEIDGSMQSLVLTCDRDEHVRATRWPETYDIYSFMLGHDSFVSAVCAEGERVFSAGGGVIIEWNVITSEPVHKWTVSGSPVKQLVMFHGVAIAIIEREHEILVLDTDEARKISMDGNVTSMCCTNDHIFVAVDNETALVAFDTSFSRCSMPHIDAIRRGDCPRTPYTDSIVYPFGSTGRHN